VGDGERGGCVDEVENTSVRSELGEGGYANGVRKEKSS
jgi:hypothetical protein